MKCLEKDRNRRYETANGLAMDLRRCLRDEPVLACPPSAGYRLRKFVRKHRRPLATAAGFVVLLTAAAVGASLAAWRLGEAEESTRRQLHRTEQAQDEATRRLYRALVLQARASRRSHGMGQRFDGVAALEQATQIARQLQLPDDFLELRDETIACLALPDLRAAREWPGWPAGTIRVDFDGGLERYARADRPGTISVRRVADDAELCRIHSGLDGPWLLLGPDGSCLAAWSHDRVKVWRLAPPEPAELVDQQGGSASAFSPDGRCFALGLDDGSIQVYDLAGGGPPRVLAPGPRPQCLAFHPRERRLAVGHESGIQIRDWETGDVLTNLPGAGDATSIAWRPDGTTLAAAGGDRVVSLWDVPSGRPTVRLEGITNGGIDLAFNHAGDLLATQGWEGKLRLWDPSDRRGGVPHAGRLGHPAALQPGQPLPGGGHPGGTAPALGSRDQPRVPHRGSPTEPGPGTGLRPDRVHRRRPPAGLCDERRPRLLGRALRRPARVLGNRLREPGRLRRLGHAADPGRQRRATLADPPGPDDGGADPRGPAREAPPAGEELVDRGGLHPRRPGGRLRPEVGSPGVAAGCR